MLTNEVRAQTDFRGFFLLQFDHIIMKLYTNSEMLDTPALSEYNKLFLSEPDILEMK